MGFAIAFLLALITLALAPLWIAILEAIVESSLPVLLIIVCLAGGLFLANEVLGPTVVKAIFICLAIAFFGCVYVTVTVELWASFRKLATGFGRFIRRGSDSKTSG